MPLADPTNDLIDEKEEDLANERSSTKMSKYAVEIPESSIAGLLGEQAEQLEDIKDFGEHVYPMAITWTPTGDFYIACSGSQLLKVSLKLKRTLLYLFEIQN